MSDPDIIENIMKLERKHQEEAAGLTPRSDAARIDNADLHDWGHGKSDLVCAEFAEGLETELTRLRDSLTKLVEEWREEAKRLWDHGYSEESKGQSIYIEDCADQLQALIK